MTAPIRTVLVDDDEVLATEIARLLRGQSAVELIASYRDAESALVDLMAPTFEVDVALIDLGLPGISGWELLSVLATERPTVERLVFTVAGDDESVFRALEAGATGYLLKTTAAQELVTSISQASLGGAPISPSIARRILERFRVAQSPPAEFASDNPKPAHLTPKEQEVLKLLARGYTYTMSAGELGIGVGTLQGYVKTVYRKLGISTKAEAAAEAFRRGLVR